MSDQVVSALTALMARWVSYQCRRVGEVWCSSDPQWRSVCETGKQCAGLSAWRPVARPAAASMQNIADALGTTLHPALSAYYCHGFAGPMAFSFKGLRVELIQPWNDDDYLLLQENLIGHALMQRRLKLPATFFIAATRDDRYLISLDNHSGAVLFERVGQPGGTELAASLPAFLARLEPLAVSAAGLP